MAMAPCAAANEFGQRNFDDGVGPSPMGTPFFYAAEGVGAVAYHKSAGALSLSETRLPK